MTQKHKTADLSVVVVQAYATQSLQLQRLNHYSYTCTLSLTHSLTHSPTHPLTHSLTHPLTHSLTHSLMGCRPEINVRDTAFKRGTAYLERYCLLIAFTSFLERTKGSDITFQASQGSFMWSASLRVLLCYSICQGVFNAVCVCQGCSSVFCICQDDAIHSASAGLFSGCQHLTGCASVISICQGTVKLSASARHFLCYCSSVVMIKGGLCSNLPLYSEVVQPTLRFYVCFQIFDFCLLHCWQTACLCN